MLLWTGKWSVGFESSQRSTGMGVKEPPDVAVIPHLRFQTLWSREKPSLFCAGQHPDPHSREHNQIAVVLGHKIGSGLL